MTNKRRLLGLSTSKTVRGPSEDIISGMPNNVIDMILEALPIRDAVRTSVLARKWQYCWIRTSELDFNYNFFESLSSKYLVDLQVTNIINKILLLHTGPMRKFTLDIFPMLSLKDDLNQWLHFLSRNGLKEVSLIFQGIGSFELGLQLYFCLQLTHLKLLNCVLNPPAAFEGFPNLTTLELCFVSVNEKFGDAISACALLQRVSIHKSGGIRNLVVRAPNLKYLHVQRVRGLKTISLNSTKYLATLSISLTGMEKLHLGDNILEFSGASSIPKRLPTSLDNLKKIVLCEVDFNNVRQVACMLCMMQSSPKLSELEIWGLWTQFAILEDLDFVEDFGDRDCSFGQLQTVELMDLRDLKGEMALIKFLLAHSPMLKQMFVRAASETDKDKSLYMCKKLMQFGRASPKASLIYLDPFSF